MSDGRIERRVQLSHCIGIAPTIGVTVECEPPSGGANLGQRGRPIQAEYGEWVLYHAPVASRTTP